VRQEVDHEGCQVSLPHVTNNWNEKKQNKNRTKTEQKQNKNTKSPMNKKIRGKRSKAMRSVRQTETDYGGGKDFLAEKVSKYKMR